MGNSLEYLSREVLESDITFNALQGIVVVPCLRTYSVGFIKVETLIYTLVALSVLS